jgi:hypothetical protein
MPTLKTCALLTCGILPQLAFADLNAPGADGNPKTAASLAAACTKLATDVQCGTPTRKAGVEVAQAAWQTPSKNGCPHDTHCSTGHTALVVGWRGAYQALAAIELPQYIGAHGANEFIASSEIKIERDGAGARVTWEYSVNGHYNNWCGGPHNDHSRHTQYQREIKLDERGHAEVGPLMIVHQSED